VKRTLCAGRGEGGKIGLLSERTEKDMMNQLYVVEREGASRTSTPEKEKEKNLLNEKGRGAYLLRPQATT